jgi:hypothetical protein
MRSPQTAKKPTEAMMQIGKIDVAAIGHSAQRMRGAKGAGVPAPDQMKGTEAP